MINWTTRKDKELHDWVRGEEMINWTTRKDKELHDWVRVRYSLVEAEKSDRQQIQTKEEEYNRHPLLRVMLKLNPWLSRPPCTYQEAYLYIESAYFGQGTGLNYSPEADKMLYHASIWWAEKFEKDFLQEARK